MPTLLIGIGAKGADSVGSTGDSPHAIHSMLNRSEIHLAATTLRPSPESSLHLKADAILPAGEYILQLDGPLTPQRREALDGAGVVLGDYLPFHAYLIRAADGYDSSKLRSLPFVRWLGVYDRELKIAPGIASRRWRTEARGNLADRGFAALSVTLFPDADSARAIQSIESIPSAKVHWIDAVDRRNVFRITMPIATISQLADISGVQFVEDTEEVVLHNATNRWIVQSNQLNSTPLHDHGLTGAGQIIGILDTGVYLEHCSFFDTEPVGPTHRKAEAINQWPGYVPGAENPGFHGTHVACTLLGDAGVNDNTRGIAYDARFVLNTTPSHDGPGIVGRLEYHSAQGAVLHTNSWGDTAVDYGSLTRGLDIFCYDYEDELVVFACGNDAVATNPQNAKNCLSVSATMDAPNQDQYCIGGAGPTVDGRRKPEICAPGCGTLSASVTSCLIQPLTGTSMATPVIAGAGALVRQYYIEGYYPTGEPDPANAFTPSAALLKATLLNSTVDLTGVAGYPSNTEGWGRLLADQALYFPGDQRRIVVLDDVRNVDGMSTGDVVEYPLIVASDSETLKVTLVYHDPPGGVGIGNGPAWVNDLDLEAVAPSGALYLGNAFVNGVSAPGGVKDERNNVEQIHVATPEVGLWTIRVRAAEVNVATQGHALIATGVVWNDPATIAIHLPDGVPAIVIPFAGTSFPVDVIEGVGTLLPGSPMLHYRYDGGSFETTPLVPDSGNRYIATLPAPNCLSAPEFYVSAADQNGTTMTLPTDAPARVFSAIVGEAVTVFHDDFESDMGWSVVNENLVSGAWVRVIPMGNGQLGDPTMDYDGSGRCYVTGANSFQDVNGGPTRLVSPAIDLSSAIDPELSYARWFRDTGEGDTLVVEITNDDGANWTLIESAGESEFWTPVTIRIADFVAPTAGVRVRFSTQDTPNNSFTEAGIDAVRIDDFGCEMNCAPGDVNADGESDGRDIARFVELLLGATPTAYELCAADLHAPADALVTTADIDGVIGCMLGNCSH